MVRTFHRPYLRLTPRYCEVRGAGGELPLSRSLSSSARSDALDIPARPLTAPWPAGGRACVAGATDAGRFHRPKGARPVGQTIRTEVEPLAVAAPRGCRDRNGGAGLRQCWRNRATSRRDARPTESPPPRPPGSLHSTLYDFADATTLPRSDAHRRQQGSLRVECPSGCRAAHRT